MDKFTDNSTKKGYFKPNKRTLYYNDLDNNHYMTKQFLISILFSNVSAKKQQKILQKAKKLNIWSVNNNIFEPFTLTISTCKKRCQHLCSDHLYDFGDCYDNNVVFQRELLKLKVENIPDNMKIKDIKDDFYWINIKVLKSLIDLFVVLISPPHSTIGFTDRTPIHLLPQQYLPLKWGF